MLANQDGATPTSREQFAALFAEPEQPTAEQAPTEETPTEEAETPEAETEEEVTQPEQAEPEAPEEEEEVVEEDVTESEVEEQGEEAEAESEEEVEEVEETDVTFEVKVNGVTKSVTEAELIAGYQMESDYRQKTEKLSQRSEVLTTKQEEAEQATNTYLQGATVLGQILQQTMPFTVEQLETIRSDEGADEYLAAKVKNEAHTVKIRAVAETVNKTNIDMQTTQQAAIEESNPKELEKLVSKFPDLATEENQIRTLKYLLDSGYSQQEVTQASAVVRHKDLILAEKARLYDELMSKKKKVTQKVKKSKTVKAGGRKAGSEKISKQRAKSGAIEKLKASRKYVAKDGVNAFAAILNS